MSETSWHMQSKFLLALQSNSIADVKSMIESGGLDVDAKFLPGGQPPISLCVDLGLGEMVDCLLDHGCSVNQMDSFGMTPLHYAVRNKRLDLVARLLDNRADVNARSVDGNRFTPLHFAVAGNCLPLLRTLVAANANLTLVDGRRNTPFLLACFLGHSEVAHFLAICGSKVNTFNCVREGPFHFVHQLKLATVRALLEIAGEQGCLPGVVQAQNFMGNSPLHMITSYYYHQFPSGTSCDRGCSDDYCDSSHPLLSYMDSLLGDIKCLLELLISHGADLNVKNRHQMTPLLNAIHYGNYAVAEWLVLSGCHLGLFPIGGVPVLKKLALDNTVSSRRLLYILVEHGGFSDQNDVFWIKEMVEWHKCGRTDGEFDGVASSVVMFLVGTMQSRQKVAKLQNLCRQRLRVHCGLALHSVVDRIQLPVYIRRFLKFENECI